MGEPTPGDMNRAELVRIQGKLSLLEHELEAVLAERTSSAGRDEIYFPSAFPSGAAAGDFSFRVSISGDLTAELTPGSVELGPATVLTWDGRRLINGTVSAASGCLTNHLTGDTTITVPAGSTIWYVWANVDIREGAEKWEIFEGATITPLTVSETQGDNVLKNTRQKILAVLIIVDDKITEAVPRQCGNIDIPRL